LGIGDWGLGIGDWAQSPIPNPQSPIPNPHVFVLFLSQFLNDNMIKNYKNKINKVYSLKNGFSNRKIFIYWI
jgi:hypothetical protein